MTNTVTDVSMIDKYITQHGQGKRRLAEVIEHDASTLDSAEVGRDDRCEFGAWLRSMGDDKHLSKIRGLHAEFHKQAGEVVRLAYAGQKEKAAASMDFNGGFAKASGALTLAMVAWKKELA